MDASEARRKYGTCLCFSVMGRKKLRISVCAISASPEAGDAPTSIMSTRRKYSAISGTDSTNAFLSQGNENPIACYASAIPSNSIKVTKDCVSDEFAIKSDLLRRRSNTDREIDYCRFPYYRSNRADGSQDAVLVKDVGISCKLLNENTVGSEVSISGVESYLVRQLKLEYNELSSITRKINAYTKDILNNLASRCRKKHQIQKLHVSSKHVMTSQCRDETGNLCLKSRFQDDAKRKCRSSEIDLNGSCAEKEIIKEKMHENRNPRKRRMEPDKVFAKGFPVLSPKYSGVLLRNYLIMKKGKVSGNASKVSLCKTKHFALSDRSCKDHSADKSREFFYTSKCNPLVLTNWREVSRRKDCRSKSALTANTSGESHSRSHLTRS